MKFPLLFTSDYTLEGQDIDGMLFLHFNWHSDSFTKHTYQELLKQWADLLNLLSGLGVDAVHSAIPHTDPKAKKWQTMFGLEPYIEDSNITVYKLEI